ncbi:MAG: NAD(P)-dependent oxidoreductase [Candidatus Iainarchaeum archaeon]|uniref:NAD(P)-dependent oxidoreductase n=1 Tax=Candidatus Iainarchaeum sp. TaxID=3101447 RepID=A0A497JHG9_9ARCH|nr:MAG: NAD(P)-dependent oxidoreductase [Candidatus Diapherotrites archaeon]
MKHVIIGGSGFIGSALTERLLQQGKEVMVCDLIKPKVPCEFKRVDIKNSEELKSIGFERRDIVYHLASRIYDGKVPKFNKEKYFYEVNVIGTKNVLQAMHEAGCKRLIYFSTDKVYGIPNTTPMKETHLKKPIGPYGRSKLAAENLCEKYRERGFKITIFRLPIVMGPGRPGIFNKVFYLIRKGMPLPLIGNGNSRYHMLSVHDCVDATLVASKNVKNETFNLGSDRPVAQRELLERLIKAAHSNSRIIAVNARMAKLGLRVLEFLHMPLMHEEQYLLADKDCILDISKAKKELNWKPKHDEFTALLEAFEHYRKTCEKCNR